VLHPVVVVPAAVRLDEIAKSHFPDGFVKAPRSRLANPEE
jgi:hypothetical protein